MRASIYNPYLDTLGGGERYTITFAKVLLNQGWNVDLFWKEQAIRGRLEERFGINLSDLKIVDDIKKGEGYDLCFWLSDGSIPLLHARKNILHFQFPFKGVGGKSLLNKMKLYRINYVIVNSEFTKKRIDYEYGVNSRVIYPPVDVEKFKPGKKQNIILSTGRFSQLTQAKRQDILVKVFLKMLKRGLSGWKLILAGGSEIGADLFLDKIRKVINTKEIEIIENPDINSLCKLYSKSKVFWSASGYGIDPNKDPLKVEHFGITTVEAMAAGCVPLVYDAGGVRELIQNEQNGYLWHNTDELAKKTLNLVHDKTLLEKLSGETNETIKKFGNERFEKEVLNLLN